MKLLEKGKPAAHYNNAIPAVSCSSWRQRSLPCPISWLLESQALAPNDAPRPQSPRWIPFCSVTALVVRLHSNSSWKSALPFPLLLTLLFHGKMKVCGCSSDQHCQDPNLRVWGQGLSPAAPLVDDFVTEGFLGKQLLCAVWLLSEPPITLSADYGHIDTAVHQDSRWKQFNGCLAQTIHVSPLCISIVL